MKVRIRTLAVVVFLAAVSVPIASAQARKRIAAAISSAFFVQSVVIGFSTSANIRFSILSKFQGMKAKYRPEAAPD